MVPVPPSVAAPIIKLFVNVKLPLRKPSAWVKLLVAANTSPDPVTIFEYAPQEAPLLIVTL